MMLVIVLFFTFYIASEADHDCCGKNCPICAIMQQCDNTLHGIGDGITGSGGAAAVILFTVIAPAFVVTAASSDTLISRKVRLND
ncbi:MAG: hypothetical protein K6F28_02150 [Lachnospiraceae bacterium]|nr:hypothetical protein [Lachnospiraceae bacterium]